MGEWTGMDGLFGATFGWMGVWLVGHGRGIKCTAAKYSSYLINLAVREPS